MRKQARQRKEGSRGRSGWEEKDGGHGRCYCSAHFHVPHKHTHTHTHVSQIGLGGSSSSPARSAFRIDLLSDNHLTFINDTGEREKEREREPSIQLRWRRIRNGLRR